MTNHGESNGKLGLCRVSLEFKGLRFVFTEPRTLHLYMFCGVVQLSCKEDAFRSVGARDFET